MHVLFCTCSCTTIVRESFVGVKSSVLFIPPQVHKGLVLIGVGAHGVPVLIVVAQVCDYMAR
jgi:hypothetical protein